MTPAGKPEICRICGAKHPGGEIVPHCPHYICDWFKCPCGRTCDIHLNYWPDSPSDTLPPKDPK